MLSCDGEIITEVTNELISTDTYFVLQLLYQLLTVLQSHTTHHTHCSLNCTLLTSLQFSQMLIKSYVNLYSSVSDRSHFKAAVQRQPQVRTLLEWRRLAAKGKVR